MHFLVTYESYTLKVVILVNLKRKWDHLIYPEAAKLNLTGMCVSRFDVELLKVLVTEVL